MNLLVTNWQDLRNPQGGGAEVHLFEIFSRLAARGHRVTLICCGFPGGAPVEVVEGIEVHRHGGRHSFALSGWQAISRAVRTLRPDVVIDDINKLPIGAPLLTSRPVYAIVPHLFGTTAFAEASWPVAATVWAAEKLIPRIYRNAWFHAISDSTRDDLVARGIPRGRIAVVYPGVDTRRFHPDPATPRRADPRFVYVGRLRRYKGIEYLIDALAEAGKLRPDLSVDIAGTGDDRARLEGRARERGVADRVRFHGYVDEATRLRLLRESVANVFPSPKEGWGITVMEAAACGTPSIASDSPGLRDSVRNGRTGILVPHGDVAALAQAMVALATDRPRAETLGRAAREWAEQLSWDSAAEIVERHLAALAAGRDPIVTPDS
ncbi:MAG TPA: glycosyltransferase family 4 protein [Gemmatimonadales bacterium]|jgi:glycosyltransferase involved in cell wall biosynthesis